MSETKKAPRFQQLRTWDEPQTIERMWSGLRRRQRNRRVQKRVAQSALLVAAVVVAFRFGPSNQGPLHLASGDALSVEIRQSVELSDASRIELQPGAYLAVEHNDGQSFRLRLADGAMRFSVTPNGPRRWTLLGTLASIEVVGTALRVVQSPVDMRIEVEHGRVVVRSPWIENRSATLGDGASLTIQMPTPRVEETVHEIGPNAIEQITHSEPADVLPAIHAEPLALRSVLLAADRARAHGDSAAAVRLLEDGLAHAPRDPQRALARYTIARLQLRDLHAFPEAAQAYAATLEDNLPTALREEAWLGCIEAHARAGNHERARQVGEAFRARFPNSSRLPELERWLEPSP